MHSPLPQRPADVSRRWAVASLVVQLSLVGALAGTAVVANAADPTDEPGPVGPTAVVAGTVWADASEIRAATGICVALLEPGSGVVVDAQLASTGSYSFPAVAPDAYTLRFADCDSSRVQPYATTYLGDGQRLDSATIITVAPYVDVLGLDARLSPATESAVTPVPPPGGAAPSAPAPVPARPSAGATSGGGASDGSLPTLSLPETTPTPTPSPTASATPTPSSTSTPAPSSDASAPDATDPASDAETLAVGWVVGGGIAVLLLAIIAFVISRRRAA